MRFPARLDIIDFDSGMDLSNILASELPAPSDHDSAYQRISATTLVRPADGTLWEIRGDKIVRVNQASNIVEV